VASIGFHILSAGTSPIVIGPILGSDNNGNPIPLTIENGSITGVIPSNTTLVIHPASTDLVINGTAAVDIMVNNVSNLYGLELTITFNAAKVEVVDADPGIAGIQIQKGVCPSPDFIIQNTVNNAAGTLSYAVTATSPSPPCNGSGKVATITFRGLAVGSSIPVHFSYSLLSDPNGQPIPHSTQDGSLTVRDSGKITGKITLQGRTNHSGTIVKAWNGATEVASATADTLGNFTLNVPSGTYKVTAEKDLYLDSEKSEVIVTTGGTTTLPNLQLPGGDTNEDDRINVQDLSYIAFRLGCNLGNACYQAPGDINIDNAINVQDLTIAGGNWGKMSPVPW
jgi:hypothetical protein